VRRAPLIAAVGACVLLAGCGLGNGLYNVPLPGGANLGDHPYTVKVEFRDALDLVPQSGVKVNNVAVGRVTKIDLEKTGPNAGKIADVYVEINGGVQLPENAVAAIDQTSLLGEKFVSLSAPSSPTVAVGQLRNGDTIDPSRTTQGVEVEVIFGALSELLNGGGIGQLHEITQELGTVAQGNGLKTFLVSLQRVVGQMNANKQAITQSLDAVNTLGQALAKDDSQITNVLQNLAPGIAILASQRDQLIAMLNSLNTLSGVTVQTLNASKQQIVEDLQNLAPILKNLAAAGSNLPQSLQVLLTYPFPDGAMSAIVGDYVNAYVNGVFRTKSVSSPQAIAWPAVNSPTVNGVPASAPRISPPAGLLPATTSAAPGLPSQLTTSPASPSSSPRGSASGSPSGSASGSPSGSASGSPSGSSSGSSSSSGSASTSAASPSGSGGTN
ncbi:MAG: MCE family protein, partial [Actinobacteria bacterium]|nr:MCE family protein [Actinomycetota bacterium]